MTAIMQDDIEEGIQLVKESVDGDLNKLPEWQKVNFAEQLAKKQRYKEALQVYELVNKEKYKEHIKLLQEKAKNFDKQSGLSK